MAVVGSLFATPVAAPIMITAAVGVASVSGIYSIGRSVATLVDRSKHEQVFFSLLYVTFISHFSLRNIHKLTPFSHGSRVGRNYRTPPGTILPYSSCLVHIHIYFLYMFSEKKLIERFSTYLALGQFLYFVIVQYLTSS